LRKLWKKAGAAAKLLTRDEARGKPPTSPSAHERGEIPMRLIIGTVLTLVLTVASSLADPAGTYRVSGTNPGNGSTYSGTVTVKRNGDTFLLAWTIAGSRQIGVGIGRDDFLAVSYRSATRLASLSTGRMRIVVGKAFGRHSAAKPSELRSGLEAPKDFIDWTAGRTQLTNPDASRRPGPPTRPTPI
jgi:hypothetical protein